MIGCYSFELMKNPTQKKIISGRTNTNAQHEQNPFKHNATATDTGQRQHNARNNGRKKKHNIKNAS